MPKVLFIVKKRLVSYGVSYGLINSCLFIAQALNYLGIESKVASVIDNNGIDKEVHDFNPTHVFIEALWVVSQKFDILLSKYKHVKWSVRIHSKIPFIATEGMAITWISEYKELMNKYNNFTVSANSEDFIQDIEHSINLKLDYTPNIYFPLKDQSGHDYPEIYGSDVDDSDIVDKSHGIIHIGCFGAIRPLKNHLKQAIAAIEFADIKDKTLHFHINSSRVEQQADNVLKNLQSLFYSTGNHKLVEHPWMNYRRFINVVKQMDMGMQVSFSETFNIVAADFVWNNIPILVSPDIEWMPDIFKANPNSSKSMVDGLELLYSTLGHGIRHIEKAALLAYDIKSIYSWWRYLFGGHCNDSDLPRINMLIDAIENSLLKP